MTLDDIRTAAKNGRTTIECELKTIVRGCRYVQLQNLDGHINGNPHDIWVCSLSGKKTLGRIHLASKKRPDDDEGWMARIRS